MSVRHGWFDRLVVMMVATSLAVVGPLAFAAGADTAAGVPSQSQVQASPVPEAPPVPETPAPEPAPQPAPEPAPEPQPQPEPAPPPAPEPEPAPEKVQPATPEPLPAQPGTTDPAPAQPAAPAEPAPAPVPQPAQPTTSPAAGAPAEPDVTSAPLPAAAPEVGADRDASAPEHTVPGGVVSAAPAPTDDPAPARRDRTTTASSPVHPWAGEHGELLSTDWLGSLSLPGLEPSEYALEDIPEEMLDRYQGATVTCPGLPWPVLAAVGKVESDHGSNGAVSSAGARGPMQFMPATWRTFGIDADGDGHARIDDLDDAVVSAAAYLCAHGGGDPERLPEALFAYNHAWWYVHRVMGVAQRYVDAEWDPAAPVEPVDRETLLDNPRLQLYPGGRADIAAGRIDPRVLDLLALLTQQHEITVVSLQTGHSMNVAGTNRVSNHYRGRAVDIAAIDGEPVSTRSPRARALVTWLASLQEPARPREVGSPFADFRSQPGHFTDAMHLGHVHVGWGEHHVD